MKIISYFTDWGFLSYKLEQCKKSKIVKNKKISLTKKIVKLYLKTYTFYNKYIIVFCQKKKT